MQIVSDSGMDLSPQQMQGATVHLVPLVFTLDGKTYRSGVDIQPLEFYKLLNSTNGMPTTSLPSPGDFAEMYRRLAATDPEILSIHISSGLSGTIGSARSGAAMVPEAHVTFFDTLTLSGGEGWPVEAALRAMRAGWPVERIVTLMEQVRAATDTIYTLATLKYLIHGGRISHLKGLLASVLNIKPIIGVGKTDGKYFVRGQVRSLNRAIDHIPELIAEQYDSGTPMRAQVMDGDNPEGSERLKEKMAALFPCTWLPTVTIAPVLGAHTGSGLVGLVYAPLSQFPALP